MHGFINLEKFTCKQNLAFVLTYTFRMKSMESFINETLVCKIITNEKPHSIE